MIRIAQKGTNRPLRRTVAQAIEAGLRKTGDHFFEVILGAADKHTKTGALVQSLQNRYVPGVYTIEHDLQRAPHAVFVHWGTRPHTIRPKLRKALRWPTNNVFAFAKVVNHPGYAGDPYMITEATPQKVASVFASFLRQGL
jgi:hypothetical protein